MEEPLSNLKKILLDTLKVFIGLCEEHNLKYFSCGGTSIGAVRHHGFIPWDDDIDLYMPRKDYEKLLLLKSSINKIGFDISSFEDNGFYPFLKFYSLGYTYWEFKCVPHVLAPYLDIFPLDEASENFHVLQAIDKKYCDTINIIHALATQYSWHDTLHCSIQSLFPRLFKKIVGYGIINKFNQKKFRQINQMGQKQSGPYLISYYHTYPLEREIFRKEWFDSYIEMPFEDIKIRVPIGYDSILNKMYGDYMKLPPEEKRVPHHDCYYMNLEKRLEVDEIIAILRKK